jgi:[acyl-carrier-protein] S-malonyltransferase
MNRAIIFPGQGSQVLGMGKDLYDNFHVAKNVFERVDDALNFSIKDIIFGDDLELLSKTENTQPALMCVSMAAIEAIKHLSGKNFADYCNISAGHSLGQYTAMCAAGCFSVEDAAKILNLRGIFMQEACPKGAGAMAAILGDSNDYLEEVLNDSAKIGICEIANDNSSQQKVISGDLKAVEFAIEKLKLLKIKAIKLNVSAPFHSSLMNSAVDKMRDVLSSIEFKHPSVKIIDNISLNITKDAFFLKEKLLEQISGTVKWRETMDILHNLDSEVIEIGPSKVLSNLYIRSYENSHASTIFNVEDIIKFSEGI